MCREAVASGQGNFSDGLNYSIVFMLGMVVLIPSAFGFLVWNSFRSARLSADRGQPFAPEGKLRWPEGDLEHEKRGSE